MRHPFDRRLPARLLAVFSLLLAGITTVSAAIPQGNGRAASTRQVTANDIPLQAGMQLPVFRFDAPQVSPDDTLNLSQRFSSIYNRQRVEEDSYLGFARYTVPNEKNQSLLERYSASGGFYAYNFTEAFDESSRGDVDPAQAQRLACLFLRDNQLFPDGGLIRTPVSPAIQCDFNFTPTGPYDVSLIRSIAQPAQGTTNTDASVLGAMVQVPMAIITGRYSQIPSVPLGGAGGHLSLLLRTTNPDSQSFSLDSSVPGLSAVAMPFYGRSFSHLRNVPSRDMAAVIKEVEAQVRASYPRATDIRVPDPNLLYMVSDAAEPQTALEPKFSFEGIVVLVDGVEIVLRDLVVPALETGPGGFGPNVSITSPAAGSSYAPGQNVTLVGAINGGLGPYSYRWTLDDGTVLEEGTTALTTLSLTAPLPAVAHGGIPAPVVVHLSVRDADGAEREALVALSPSAAPVAYLPLAVSQSTQTRAVVSSANVVTPADISIAASNYSFGVESGSDYPPYGAGGSDLPGVVPDAGGFRTSMLSYGWNQSFYWSNASAWERDWRDCSLGGGDCTYGVDRADFVYWAGHGSNGGISLPSNRDSSWFPGTNARFQRARWVGFASCLTLRAQWPTPSAAPIRDWFNSFQGAHMLLGFNSLMADVAFGPRLVDNMRMPTFLGIPMPWAQRSIRDAWTLTAFNMNAGKPAYIYAVGSNGVNPVNNKLPRPSDGLLPRPYPVASYHWVWWDE